MTQHNEQSSLPTCHCGQAVKYAVGSQCEDCYAEVAAKYHGNDQSVKTSGGKA